MGTAVTPPLWILRLTSPGDADLDEIEAELDKEDIMEMLRRMFSQGM